MPANYPAGPSKLSSKHDSGEFTDSEDEGIPLSDIREAEFSRLSHDQAPILHSEPSSARPSKLSAFSWPWRWSGRKGKQLQNYLPVGEDESQSLAAQRVITGKQERKACSCQKVGWVIIVVLLIACLGVLTAAAVTGYIPNPLSKEEGNGERGNEGIGS